LLPGGLARHPIRLFGGPPRKLLEVLGDGLAAAVDGTSGALSDLRRRLRLERLPSGMEMSEGGLVDHIVDAMTVALEGFAGSN